MSFKRVSVCLTAVAMIVATPVLAADKSITPDGKPAPLQPLAKPGSEAARAADEANKAKLQHIVQEIIFEGDKTIAGNKISFPQNSPSVRAIEITLAPGEETAWHQHIAPLFAYIIEGEITVTYEELGKKIFRKGDGFLEALGLTHRGKNTGSAPVKILAVYLLGDSKVSAVKANAPGSEKEKVE